MKPISMRRLPVVLAFAISCAFAFAQTAGAPSTRPAGTGSSVTGGQAAPQAQPGGGTRNKEAKSDDQLSRGDRRFVQKAAESGMYEVQIAQLAASRAKDPQVKSFASMLVDHHTQANNELIQLANAKKVELPAAPPRAMRRDIEKLAKKTGADFDRDFVRDVGIQAHEKDIKLFDEASRDLKDGELKAFAAKTLPTLREHLAKATALPQSGRKPDAAAMGHTGGAPATGAGPLPAGPSGGIPNTKNKGT